MTPPRDPADHPFSSYLLIFLLSSHCIPLTVFRIGEKYEEWSDITPSLDAILAITTLYWLTDTFPSSIYTYR